MANPSAIPPETQAKFKGLMEANRDTTLVFLSAQLNELFGSTDEALMDFAENSESAAVQSRFYEAIGFIRKYRSQLEHSFREFIHQGFDEFASPSPIQEASLDMDSGNMSLIGVEEMEESVAIQNLITRARNSYFASLHALGQRLAVVNAGRKVPEEELPGGPDHLVNSFKQAMGDLTIDIKAKIVLYALYEKFVMKNLKGLYDEQNDNLKQAGVLPNLRPTISRDDIHQPPHVRQAGEPARQDGEPSAATERHGNEPESKPVGAGGYTQLQEGDTQAPSQSSLGRELFSSILGLLASRRDSGLSLPSSPMDTGIADGSPTIGGGSLDAAPGGAAATNEDGFIPGAGGGTFLDTLDPSFQPSPKLISAIDNIRPAGLGQGRGVLGNLNALPEISVDPQFLDKLKGVLQQERQEILSQVDEEEIQGVDSDTIDLVGMLFEYMLNDPLLPNMAKALLSHLHTPYLKLSLTDRQLLVDSDHPARLLLDMLVEAGGQWVYENDINRGIYPHMQQTVDRILQEFIDNENLFPELISKFRTAMEEQRRKSDAIESRAQESVKGREKLQVAKMRSAKEMQARVQMTPMPKSARRFLTQAWSDRLVFILLRHDEGELSDEWTQALQVADDLVWLFDPASSDAGDIEIRNTAQRVHEAVENALDTLGGYHQHYLKELYSFLDDPDTINVWRADQELSDMVDSALADSDPLLGGGLAAANEAVGTGGRQGSDFNQAAVIDNPLSDEEKDMLAKLQTLKFGTWFEFDSDRVTPRKLKLSWLSPLTSSCMFVDKSGVQAEVKALEDVARMLVSGKTRIIPKPKHQFVERAMLAIKSTLQRSMEATD